MYHSPDIQGRFDATINVFDNSKTSPTRLMRLCTQILLLGASELRMIDLKTRKAILYRKGYIYNCRLLPGADGFESMMFEAEDIPVGKYRLE